jgi:hypothetical protein
MAKFVYTVNLPVSKQTVQLTEISYIDFKNIVKNIANENNDIIFNTFNDILKQYCIEDTDRLSVIDKLYILLTIRAVCISPVLELVVTCPRTKEQFNTTINIDDILSLLTDNTLKEKTISYPKNLKITYNLPTSLYINRDVIDAVETVINCISLNNYDFHDITAEMINKLPAVVLNDIQTYANDVYLYLNEIKLLNIPSPYSADENDTMIITANVFNNSVLEFLKLCFNRDLMSFYKLEYFLMKQFRMTYETMSSMTPVELNVYTNLFKEEQAEQEKAEKKANTDQNTPAIGRQADSGITGFPA